jgi:hypothetical protein
VVVLGVGGRLVMFVSRLLHPEAAGLITENGNRVGEFTIDGTIELIMFGGVGFGLAAGVIWVLVRQWMPESAVLVGVGAVAIGGSLLIQADNADFIILVNPQIDLVLLISLVFTFGASLYWVDGWLDTKMPDPPRTLGVVIYSFMVLVGVVFSYATFASLFSEDFCFCSNPPRWTGVFLIATAVASITWWIQLTRGAEKPSTRLNTFGTTSLTLTALAGAIHLAREIIDIL